jgi:GntR family transcriptional regulator, rspAB operon transcriptional repressor
VTPSVTRDGQSVADVHERLRTAILRGEIEAGATISQGLLASEFGVGRTPLREALRMLQREGLVISEPNRQVRIARLSAADAEELHVMRIALETVAVRITVPALRSRDLAELEGYLAQMDHYRKADDEAGFRTPHRAFHHLLIAGSGRRVSEQIGELADHSERYRLRFGGLGRWDDRRAQHRAILDAAAAHDPELAARRLAVHHALAASLVLGALDPEHDLGRLRTTIRAVAPGAEDALSLPADRPMPG